jgi:peptidoglycan/xylan/chitin deacetylase (PgdA/CDA1 family)
MEPQPRGPQLAITFDVDGPANWIGTLGTTSAGSVSRGEFEPIGIGRVLRLLREFGVPATFFVSGSTALLYPRSVEAMVAGGHEVAHHGWVHENPSRLTLDEERSVLEKGIDAIERVANVKPVGYRSPGWDNSANTVGLLLEYGFEYDSSLMGGDFEPYWCRIGDQASIEFGLKYGRPVPLVELPVTWHLDDFAYFEPVTIAGLSLPGLQPTSAVLETWRGELDYLCREVGDGLYLLTLHPQVIGRGYRMALLRSSLEYVSTLDRVRYVTCADHVREWRQGREPSLPVESV